MRLSGIVAIDPRFARSANIERDQGEGAIAGYVPTGRALDLLRRIARGLSNPSAGRAFSVTGPHGGGKSSFAVYLRALLGDRNDAAYVAALEVLRASDADLAADWEAAISEVGAGDGVLTAFATASQESVTRTVARAVSALEGSRISSPGSRVPDPTELLSEIRKLAAQRPVVLVIDEFGKNLQSYAASGVDGDPYLLQEIAEMSAGANALPIVLITMQHLSFDEYVQEATSSRRREWAKVQGRFQDVPYVETSRQARALIASTVRHNDPTGQVRAWAADAEKMAEILGLPDLAETLEGTYPLHPLVLAVLPDLCSRYGQNERTLFSFLAGPEPRAVPALLDATELVEGGPLPTVGLDHVYDYFVDSASTSVGAASGASRWLEIETRIRDAFGLTHLQSRILKSVGVLNLVSSGGSIRASRAILRWAAEGYSDRDFESVLADLESRGLITYREFADEFRIWSGSDFDLRGAVEVARREASIRPLAALLNEFCPLEPTIAGRHSQHHGVLRVYRRFFSEAQPVREDLQALQERHWDGHLVYLTGAIPQDSRLARYDRPVILVEPADGWGVLDAAIEAAALAGAVRSVEAGQADWVAQRELQERLAVAQQRLVEVVAKTWDLGSTRWTLANTGQELDGRRGASVALSQASDVVYDRTPLVANEMIARRELTSQGAKARRFLIDAMLANSQHERFGVEGFPAERAMYEAVFRATGLHRQRQDGSWGLMPPRTGGWAWVWREIDKTLSSATERRLNLRDIMTMLTAPPIGLKDGILPVLLIAALQIRHGDVALYEHGSLVLSIDDAVAERLAKNPGHFSVKNLAAEHGGRQEVVRSLAEVLRIRSYKGEATLLQIAQALYREMRTLTPFAQQTSDMVSERSAGIRRAFQTASEPDVLIFTSLPEVLGLEPFPPGVEAHAEHARAFASALADAVLELRAVYPALLEEIAFSIGGATGIRATGEDLQRQLAAQSATIDGRVLEPRLRAFVGAAGRDRLEYREWLENLAMVIAEGRAPRVWTDDLKVRFRLQVSDLGGALRRTLALYFDRQTASDGFIARRVTVTNPDGSESSDVLYLTDSESQLIDLRTSGALAALAKDFGTEEAARRALLAWIVSPTAHDVDETARIAASQPREDTA